MPVIFVLGILGIAFEEQIKINKTATALLTCDWGWRYGGIRLPFS